MNHRSGLGRGDVRHPLEPVGVQCWRGPRRNSNSVVLWASAVNVFCTLCSGPLTWRYVRKERPAARTSSTTITAVIDACDHEANAASRMSEPERKWFDPLDRIGPRSQVWGLPNNSVVVQLVSDVLLPVSVSISVLMERPLASVPVRPPH